MKIKTKKYGTSYKAKLIKNAIEIIDNCNCWLEDENTSSDQKEWFQFEKDTIYGLLRIINEEELLNND